MQIIKKLNLVFILFFLNDDLSYDLLYDVRENLYLRQFDYLTKKISSFWETDFGWEAVTSAKRHIDHFLPIGRE
jgi:hypothetical protein